MKVKLFLFTCLFFAVLTNVFAQQDTSIKPNKISMFSFNFGADVPLLDMAARYGNNLRLGAAFLQKRESNFIWGVKVDFLSGNTIREAGFLQNLIDEKGQMIDQNGNLHSPGFFERGYLLGAQLGKVVLTPKNNPNSGLLLLSGIGFMQHRIKIFDRDNLFPQFRNDYYKGYDRLSNGAFLEQYIGYLYFGKKKSISIHAGLDVVYGFVSGRRDYLFDLNQAGTGRRNDILVGLRTGLVIPMFRRKIEEIYY